jgi:hypothetical protein
MSQNFEFLIPILIVLAFGLLIFTITYFNDKNIILRKLSKIKHKRITQFRTDELTKVSGKVLKVSQPFLAPLSKRKCVAYIFEVKQRVSSGKSSHWKTLVKKEDIQDFFLEQNGELVMIKPSRENRNYVSYMVEDKNIKSGSFKDPSPEFKKVLDDFGIKSENWLGFNKTLKYSERIIEIGETITVAGIAKWKILKEPIEGYSFSKIAALESNKNHKLIITDYPDAIKPLDRGF